MDDYQRLACNYFSTNGIDRVAERRRDEAWLAARLEDRRTRFIPVWNLKNLFTAKADAKPVFLSPRDLRDLAPDPETTTLLGARGNRTYFALGLPSQGDEPPSGWATRGQFRELRQVAPLLGEQDSALLAYARAMIYWHGRHRFCGDCGHATRSVEGGTMRVCTNLECGQQHFPRTDPAVIVLVTRGERCLLGRKPWWPEGMYSNVAGFVEPGESLEDAVKREVREETGVEVQGMSYHSSQPWPFPSSLMLGFMAVAGNGSIRVDRDELEDARWFTREEIRAKLAHGTLRLPSAVSVSYRLIEDWFDAGSSGRLRSLVPG